MSSAREDEVATSARLAFLKTAARALHSSSLSTSSHLLQTHRQLLLDKAKPIPIAQHKEYCGACGSLRMPDWPKTPYKEEPNLKRRRRRQRLKHASAPRKKILIDRRPPARPTQTQASTVEKGSTAQQQQHPSDNAGSKKRAKARKQQGLLASLQAKKTQQQSSSLDLLDFLQP
ncbi:hypothetical protein KEM56_007254 [Ascosphaera pollenicola]|nr:hypothetical protein KEM56_007254 [Ascosphaera pollenicola]